MRLSDDLHYVIKNIGYDVDLILYCIMYNLPSNNITCM